MEKQSTTLVASNEEIIRKTSEYHPSIWGDYFINNTISPTPAKVSIRAEELKEQIKNLFRETNDILQIINFIDAIQLLGLDYQFEKEIDAAWWNDLALAKSLNFVRDRLVECYYWILNVYFEPQYSRARLICTKVISILSIMDDIYDNYSTLQESQLLTEAIQRWEPQAVDIVPEYLKDFYLRFLRTFKEFENELESDEKYRISFLQDEIKAVSTSYFIEAKWGIEKYVPTLEEHLSNSLITAGYAALACASYIGMGPVATKEAFEWVASFPKILKASSLIGRLMDDIKSHKLEQERDHAASTVESYMKEFATDEKEAYKNLMEMVEDAWKDHNKEYLNPTQIARVLVERIVNLSRIIEEFYKHSDSYTNSKTTMKDNIYMVLVESVPI